MLRQQDDIRLETLRVATADILRDAIGDVQDVALLDMPNQRNVGDSLIWAGETAYLDRLGLRVRYAADISGFDAADLRAAMPRGVVLLHGGGNFGDLWPGHQQHREQIVAELADYRIVQLPQSVYFGSAAAAERADDVLSRHPDFTILLRDRESIARADAQLPRVASRFCYDMAFGYTPRRVAPSGSVVLVIARGDIEKSSGLADIGTDWLPGAQIARTDWGRVPGVAGLRWRIAREIAKADHRLVRAHRAGRAPRLRAVHRWAERAIVTINSINIAWAENLYATARLVIVDRLHAHVLAGLMGIEHIALDNNYRKIGSVFDEYSGAMSTAHYATDLDEARAIAVRLLEA